VLRVEGEMVAVPQAPGGVELHDPHFSLLTRPAGALPFELRRPQLEIQLPTLLDHAALSWRHPHHRALASQFYKQTMVGVYERVYATAPVFRAEPHDTARHLAEYFSLDAEMGFVTDHRDVVALLREVLAAIFAAVAERAAEAVEVLALRLPEVPSEIPSIHFQDAQELIERATGEPVAGETDLAPSHERLLGAWAEREFQSELLLVVG
jgi:nondiscriminating aspartyl-tRNA synthetase